MISTDSTATIRLQVRPLTSAATILIPQVWPSSPLSGYVMIQQVRPRVASMAAITQLRFNGSTFNGSTFNNDYEQAKRRQLQTVTVVVSRLCWN